jgi:hypothetical protein
MVQEPGLSERFLRKQLNVIVKPNKLFHRLDRYRIFKTGEEAVIKGRNQRIKRKEEIRDKKRKDKNDTPFPIF